MLDPKNWHKLNFFALVQPDADILPVRAVYGENRVGSETNIGLNPLISDKPIWFAGPDIVASRILAGKAPKMLARIRKRGFLVERRVGFAAVELGRGA